MQEAQTVPGAMDVEEHVMTEQEAEEFVICVSLRKSTRTTRYNEFMGSALTDRHVTEENLSVNDINGRGKVLFVKNAIC